MSDPTQYIKSAVQRANGMGGAAKDDGGDDDMQADGSFMADAAALADDYEEEEYGVSNHPRYAGGQRPIVGLGLEQGLAMEVAVSNGVVLSNDALDELASIPRKQSHTIIRDLAKSPEARLEPIIYIKEEVARVRASMRA